MTNIDPWSTFFQSGSVLDYLRFRAYENAAEVAKSGEKPTEGEIEAEYYGPDYQRTEFR
ncbi:MAG: hypothetical protein LBM65_04705 [Oscillospiraceae bacterium]|nr:hypothetical protein [Oscillospiraceae bacterium]